VSVETVVDGRRLLSWEQAFGASHAAHVGMNTAHAAQIIGNSQSETKIETFKMSWVLSDHCDER